MGSKAIKSLIAILLLITLIPTLDVRAASVKDLYNFYDIDYDTEVPSQLSETIKGYDSAKKYVEMYHHVVTSEFDTTCIDIELQNIDIRLSEIENELLGGYYLTLNDIYLLEDEYYSLLERKDDLIKSLETYTVDVDSVNTSNVPSYEDYKNAVRDKNDFTAKLEIGVVDNLTVPLQSEAILIESTDLSSTYKTVTGTGVLSLFNGVVESVEDSDNGLSIVINHYNGVKSYYDYLEETSLVEGATVYQNQNIGYILGNKLNLRLSLNGEFVNVSELFKEE